MATGKRSEGGLLSSGGLQLRLAVARNSTSKELLEEGTGIGGIKVDDTGVGNILGDTGVKGGGVGGIGDSDIKFIGLDSFRFSASGTIGSLLNGTTAVAVGLGFLEVDGILTSKSSTAMIS